MKRYIPVLIILLFAACAYGQPITGVAGPPITGSAAGSTAADVQCASACVDISSETNLAGTSNEVCLTGDTLGLCDTTDLGGKTSFELPNSATPTVDAVGECAMDSNIWGASVGGLVCYDGTQAVYPIAVTVPGDCDNNEIPKFVSASGTWTCQADNTGAAGGAFDDSGDPVVLNTSSKTVTIGDAAGATGKLAIDGDADEVQLTVRGHSTQTSNLLELEQSDGTNVLVVANDGSTTIGTVSDPADSGVIALDNSTSICWEASPAGTDVCVSVNSSEVFSISGGTVNIASNVVTGTVTKSIYWSAGAMSSDGTNCADPAEVTINSGPKQYSIICTDNDGSRMHGMVVMPDGWNAGTLTFEVSYVQTAADTAVLNMDVAAACRDAGTAINSTYGTEVAIDDAAVSGSNIIDQTTSGAVTANGTCVAGDLLYWYLDIDATGTTTAMATLNILGVKMEYTWNQSAD